jgi:L-xylulose reductase
MDFTDERILVTGATKGIGRSIARNLRALGANIVATGRNKGELDELKKEIGSDGHLVDFRDPDAVRAFARNVQPIDRLVNNAGASKMQPFLETTVDAFHEQMDVNVLAALIISQECARSMIDRRFVGAIVNVSSVSSTFAFPDHASYCASKGALDALTAVMALELGPHGIRVNAVNPTVVMTKMAELAWRDPSKAGPLLKRIPMGRFVEPEEVADAVAFLLSKRAAMINGVTLPIDGGLLVTGGTN